jgi:tetratricopeptide (TPR) repeat protein
VARQIETLPTRRLMYQLAVLDGDEQAALTHLQWARDRPREFDMVGARAQAVGWSGRVREARQLYEDAARIARLRNLPDVGTSHLAWATSMELAYGNRDAAIQLSRRVLAGTESYDPRLRLSWILALTESESAAESVADELAAAKPAHTLINAVLVPIVRAAIALRRDSPAQALEHLRVVAPYELGFVAAFVPVYLRALAYLRLGSFLQAGEQFKRILDNRGSDPFSPFHAVASLGLARSYAEAGNVTASLEAYERFLTAWQAADPDIPALVEARAEYRELADGVAATRRG